MAKRRLISIHQPATVAPAGFMRGTNVGGGDYGPTPPPRGTLNAQYLYPSSATPELAYLWAKNFRLLRFPFLWERITSAPGSALTTPDITFIRNYIAACTGQGFTIIADLHNYFKYNGVEIGITGGPTVAQYIDVWLKLAALPEINNNPLVWIELMNEPYGVNNNLIWNAHGAVVTALRSAGVNNKILVMGNPSGWSWTSGGVGGTTNAAGFNAQNFDANVMIDTHIYLDAGGSGLPQTVVSATIGSQRAADITNWCTANGRKCLLGEWHAPEPSVDPNGQLAITDFINYMKAHPCWVGHTYQLSGGVWGAYVQPDWWPSLTPQGNNFALVSPQMQMILNAG